MRLVVLIVTSFLLAAPCLAEPPSVACWEVISSGQGVSTVLVKVNKCTGETWVLVRTMLVPAKQSAPEQLAWRWRPLATEAGEAVVIAR
jgi:hypothetical protein